MGTCGTNDRLSDRKLKTPKNIINEMNTGHKPVLMKIANKVMSSICKIIINEKGICHKGTGFFLKIKNSLYYLITNYHVINPDRVSPKIEIEIHNHNKMALNLRNRNINYLEIPKDITIIEIKESDEIFNDIEFLNYDMNYIQNGYYIYKGVDVFTIGHPNGDDASCSSGTIVNIYDYEFEHNISTNEGSSGCPIILLNNNINLIQVIGIHKNADTKKKLNGGTFIGEVLKELFINLNNNYFDEQKIPIKNEEAKVLELTSENFFKEINKNRFTLVHFYARWAGPCLIIKNFLNELVKKYINIDFRQLDVEKEHEIADYYRISIIPMCILFKCGKNFGFLYGQLPILKELDNLIQKAIK